MTTPRAQQAVRMFVQLGWPPVAALGLVSRLQQESNPDLDTGSIGDNGASYGLAQWRDSRRQDLQSWASSQGLDPGDFETQVRFIDHELRTTESTAGQQLMGARSLNDAVTAAMNYERPSGWSREQPTGGMGYGGTVSNAAALSGLNGPVAVAPVPTAPARSRNKEAPPRNVPTPQSNPPAAAAQAGPGPYTVVSGDNLWNIAARFLGDGRRYTELAALNGIANPSLIQPGQVIQFPGAAPAAPQASAPFPRPRPATPDNTPFPRPRPAAPAMPDQNGLGPLYRGDQPYPQVAPGNDYAQPMRPLNPAGGQLEHTQNPDGSHSSEITVGVQMPDGSIAVVPSLWLQSTPQGRQAIRLQDEDAIAQVASQYEQATSSRFPRFGSWDEADAYANQREANWPAEGTGMGANQPLVTHMPVPRPADPPAPFPRPRPAPIAMDPAVIAPTQAPLVRSRAILPPPTPPAGTGENLWARSIQLPNGIAAPAIPVDASPLPPVNQFALERSMIPASAPKLGPPASTVTKVDYGQFASPGAAASGRPQPPAFDGEIISPGQTIGMDGTIQAPDDGSLISPGQVIGPDGTIDAPNTGLPSLEERRRRLLQILGRPQALSGAPMLGPRMLPG